MTKTIHTGITLKVQDGNGAYRTASSDEIISAAHAAINRRFRKGVAITSPAASQEYLQLKLAHLECEMFAVLWLDNRHRILAFEELFRGTINGASVHPREVVKAALAHNAAACILAHNHPSGQCEPSSADRALTGRLKDALALIDVRVLDHIIVGDGYLSFAQAGLL